MQEHSPRKVKAKVVRIGDREILTRGLSIGFWGDVYHRALTATWPQFFTCAALFYLCLNSIFAVIFLAGDHPIANAQPGSFSDLFFFSVETLATVGYGDMHPQTYFGHILATTEIFTGMSCLAVMTGLIFTRFARPRAQLIFARSAVVSVHDGQLMLMVRIANARSDVITDAEAKMWMVHLQTTLEGDTFRRFRELRIERRENPLFALSWTLFHLIDESSPVFGQSSDDLHAIDANFIVTIRGYDEASSQYVYARQGYTLRDVRWNHRYLDILGTEDDGRTYLDYAKFHDTETTDQ
jgi:inward rectifier potassium channel